MHSKAEYFQKRIAIIGPILSDKNSSGGEGEKLFTKLKNEGFVVYKRSRYRNKILRLIDTLFFIFWYARKIDVVVIMIFGGQSFILESLALISAKLLRKNTIGVIHGGAFHEFYYRKTLVINYIFNQFSSLHTPSKFLQHFFWAKGHNVNYLPNFIEFKSFYLPQHERVFNYKIIWIRALHSIYNPQLAIEAVKLVQNEFPSATLTMIGPDKGELDNCVKLAKELNINESVNLIGFVPNNNLVNYLHEHDLFVNTTNYESFGVSLMEAASTGIPIVSTDVGEIPYIWKNNENILLSKVNDKEDLSVKIVSLFRDQNKRHEISESALECAKQYEWSEIKLKWLNLLS
jgi:glycosyltransferase involved in cell wall biosynthesis